jgi:uncharacterized repeat protein (TIGR01451 family)
LRYSFRFTSNFADGVPREEPDVPPDPELTPDDIADMVENFDFDGDGLVNAFDNCSAIANPDQEDLDQDGLGDVCEASQSDLGMHIEATPEPAALLEDLTYTAVLYNLGPEDATNVTVAIAMDEGMSFVASASTGCTEIERVIGCSAGSLAVGDSATVMAVVQPTEAKTLSVTATLSSSEVDPLPDNNSVVVETEVPTTIGIDDAPGVPTQFRLGAAYPNPFNPVTTISFDVAQPARVLLTVSNILGQQVRVLEDDILTAGRYERVFDASGLPSGVYFYSISMGDYRGVGTVLLVK